MTATSHTVGGGIERDDIAPTGPRKGHRYGCHVFECAGCPLPADHCTCDYAKRHPTDENRSTGA